MRAWRKALMAKSGLPRVWHKAASFSVRMALWRVAGDLMSRFVKMRMGKPLGSRTAGVDQFSESVRPALDKLAHELSLCLRYYSVTFRGQPLSQMVLGGGEATDALAEWLAARLDLPCEVGNPLRPFDKGPATGRDGQWDVAAGLALRDLN